MSAHNEFSRVVIEVNKKSGYQQDLALLTSSLDSQFSDWARSSADRKDTPLITVKKVTPKAHGHSGTYNSIRVIPAWGCMFDDVASQAIELSRSTGGTPIKMAFNGVRMIITSADKLENVNQRFDVGRKELDQLDQHYFEAVKQQSEPQAIAPAI